MYRGAMAIDLGSVCHALAYACEPVPSCVRRLRRECVRVSPEGRDVASTFRYDAASVKDASRNLGRCDGGPLGEGREDERREMEERDTDAGGV